MVFPRFEEPTPPMPSLGVPASTNSLDDVQAKIEASRSAQDSSEAGSAGDDQQKVSKYGIPYAVNLNDEEYVPYLVYIGNNVGTTDSTFDDTPRGFGSGEESSGVGFSEDISKSIDKLAYDFEKAPQDFQKQMAVWLALGGYAPGETVDVDKAVESALGWSIGEAVEAYRDLLSDSSEVYTNRGKRLTPMQILARAIAFRLPVGTEWNGNFSSLNDVIGKAGLVPAEDGSSGGGGTAEEPFTGSQSTTSVSRNIMDPTDARQLARALMLRELGREPTEEEFADFVGALQSAQRGNPTVTTQTGHFEDGELTKTTSTTRGGINPEEVALQKVRKNPSWAEWQAVGTYAPALFEALGATVPGR